MVFGQQCSPIISCEPTTSLGPSSGLELCQCETWKTEELFSFLVSVIKPFPKPSSVSGFQEVIGEVEQREGIVTYREKKIFSLQSSLEQVLNLAFFILFLKVQECIEKEKSLF